jgi:hypothetical protein
MANSLSSVLANIPGLAGYEAARQQDQEMQLGQLRQVGGLQAILAQAQKQQMENQFRQEIATARTPEEKLAVASKYMGPDGLARMESGSLDRAAAREAAATNAAAMREQRLAELTQRGEQEIARIREQEKERRITKEEADAREGRMRENMARLVASLRPPPAQEPLHPVMGPDGKAVLLPRSQAVGKEPFRPGQQPERALPASLAKGFLENTQNLRKAETAMKLLEGEDVGSAKGDKNATGKKGLLTLGGVLGDMALNAADPAGVDTRAAVGDLGSMVIHDRSGAAVTAAEFPRLRPFIPLATDHPDVARKKTKRFWEEYKNEVESQREFFTASGYKVPTLGAAPTTAPPAGATGGWSVVK